MASDDQIGDFTVAQGSTVQMLYVRRAMKVYALPESELKGVALMNTLASVFFSAGSGFLSLGIGIWVDSAFQEELSPAGEILAKVTAPAAMVVAAIFGCLGIWALRARGSSLKTIQQESQEITDE
jgi:hypothetical protein